MTNDKELEKEQLLKFAKDLRNIYESEKDKRKSLEESRKQLEKYAEDLRETINKLKIANKKLRKQVEIEEREKDLQLKLIHTNKMTSLGTMASGIAHEINNPVNFLLSNSQLLLEIWDELEPLINEIVSKQPGLIISGLDGGDIQKTVPEMLRGNIEGLRRIIRIIDSIGKFGRGNEINTHGTMNIKRAMDFVLSLLNKNISLHTDHLQVNIPDNLPDLKGDQGALEQVLINIIQNALQSLPGKEAGVIIDVFIRKKKLLIRVEDEGIGISSENLSNIFDPFFTTRKLGGGTGLGLYISYSLIQKLNGNLKIDSEVDKGTIVEIFFPLF